jgi:hypothetical protein
MATYNNQDQKNLEELLEEGIFDRLKARGAQAVGAVKGAGQQLKGAAQEKIGQATSKVGEVGAKAFGGSQDNELTRKGQEFQQKGQSNVQAGGSQAENAKIDSYMKTVDVKIDKMLADITNDLTKLGIQIPGQKRGLIQGAATNIKNHLTKALQGLKQ